MEKEMAKGRRKRTYTYEDVLHADWIQKEALRRSPEYREFYGKAEKEYHQPLKKYYSTKNKQVKNKLQEQINNAFDSLRTEAQKKFGLSLEPLILQGLENFPNPETEWPKEILFFPDHHQYSNILRETMAGLAPVKRITNSSESIFKSLKNDHEIFAVDWTEPFNEDLIIKEFKFFLTDLSKKRSYLKERFGIGTSKPVINKKTRQEKSRMPALPREYDNYFKWYDYYIEMNQGKPLLGMNREGYGRIAKKFNVEAKAVEQGIRTIREIIAEAGKGQILFPLFDKKYDRLISFKEYENSITKEKLQRLTDQELKERNKRFKRIAKKMEKCDKPLQDFLKAISERA